MYINDLGKKQNSLTAGSNITISNNTISATNTTYSTATTSTNGLMSSSDKTKLNGIATNATANKGTVTGTGGSATKPVYVNSSGAVTSTTYSLGSSVPANAIFFKVANWTGIPVGTTEKATSFSSLSIPAGSTIISVEQYNGTSSTGGINRFGTSSDWLYIYFDSAVQVNAAALRILYY